MTSFFSSGTGLGTAIVLAALGCILFLIMAENLRARLGSVRSMRDLMIKEWQQAASEAEAARDSNDDKARALGDLEREYAARTARMESLRETRRQRLEQTAEYLTVLDQTIQPSHAAWIVTIRSADNAQHGRRYLVFSDDDANARRRMEARFPPGAGFSIDAPQPFNLA